MGFWPLRDCPNGLFEIAVVDAGGGTSFLLRLVAEETEALRGQCRVLCSAFSWLHYFFVNAFASI